MLFNSVCLFSKFSFFIIDLTPRETYFETLIDRTRIGSTYTAEKKCSETVQQDGIYNNNRTSKISGRETFKEQIQEYANDVGDYTRQRKQKLLLPRALGGRGGRRKSTAAALEGATPGPTKSSTMKSTHCSAPTGGNGSGQAVATVRSRYSRKKKKTSRHRYTNGNQPLPHVPPQDSFWSTQGDYASNSTLPSMHFYNCQDTATTTLFTPLPLLNYSNNSLNLTAASSNEDAMLWQPYPLDVGCNDEILGQSSYSYHHYQQYLPHFDLTTDGNTDVNSFHTSNGDYFIPPYSSTPFFAWKTTASCVYNALPPPLHYNINASLSSHGCSKSLPFYSYDYGGTTFYYSPSDVQVVIPTCTMSTPTAVIDAPFASNEKQVNCNSDSVLVRSETEDVLPVCYPANDTAISQEKTLQTAAHYDCNYNEIAGQPVAAVGTIHSEEYLPYFYEYYHCYDQNWQPPCYTGRSADTCFLGGCLIVDPTNSSQQYHDKQQQKVALSTVPSSTTKISTDHAPTNAGKLIPLSCSSGSSFLKEEEESSTITAADFSKDSAHHSSPVQASKQSAQQDELLSLLLKAFHLEFGKIKDSSLYQAVIQHAKSHATFSYRFDNLLTKVQYEGIAMTEDRNAVSTMGNKTLTKSQELQQLEGLLLLALEIKCNMDVVKRIVVKCMNTYSSSAIERFALAELPLQDHQNNVPKCHALHINASKGKKKARGKEQRYPFLESVLERLMFIITNSFQAQEELLRLDGPTPEGECSKTYFAAYEEYHRLVTVAQLLHKKRVHMNQPTKQMFEKYASKLPGSNMSLLHAIQNGKSWDWIKNMVLDKSPASIIKMKKEGLYPCFIAATCEASSLDVLFQLLVLNTCWLPP